MRDSLGTGSSDLHHILLSYHTPWSLPFSHTPWSLPISHTPCSLFVSDSIFFAAPQAKTVVVPNVDEFPGHIACSSKSKSEIVVPIIRDGEVGMDSIERGRDIEFDVFGSDGTVVAVLDVDSIHLNTFDEVDAKYLELLVAFIKWH